MNSAFSIPCTILVALIGLVVGSFLNVLIYRSKEEKLSTIFFSRSYCPGCKHVLSWLDLFPLFSFLYLRGKCRYCGKPISYQYPVVELITAIIFIALYLFYGLSLAFAFYAIVFAILLVIAVHDFLTQETLEIFVWIALAVSLLGGWYFGEQKIISIFYGALIGGGVPGLLVLISKEKWMGAGDIKIGLILGILLGYPLVIAGIFSAFVIGAIVGLLYIKFKNASLKDSLPFAPFLVISTLLALLWGERVINWYLGSFFIVR